MSRKKTNKKQSSENKASYPNKTKEIKPNLFLRKNIDYIILSAILLSFFTVASQGLGQFFTTDETFWFFQWVQEYWNAYSTGNFKATNFSSYPGATVSFLTGITNLFLNPQEYFVYDKIETYFYWWRFPILITNVLFLAISYPFLKKLLNTQQALFIVFFTAFTPIIFGMARIVNPDSLVWGTIFISILSFIVALRENKKSNIIISGIFMGLALSTKYSAVGVFVFQILLIFLEFFLGHLKENELKKATLKLFSVWIISLVIFTLILPAAFANTSVYWRRIFRFFALDPIFITLISLLILDVFVLKNKIFIFLKEKLYAEKISVYGITGVFFTLFFVALMMKFFNLTPESWKTSSGQWNIGFFAAFQKNLSSFFFFQQPMVIIGSVIFSVLIFMKKQEKQNISLPIYSLLFVLFFILGASVQGVTIANRYTIMLFPFMIIVMIWSFNQFKKAQIILISLAILLTFIDFSLLFPRHYIFYRNDAYTTTQKHYDWSLGGYELAQKMNQLPNAEKMTVLADRHSFKFFFKGKTDEITVDLTNSVIKKYDYLCLSSAGKRSYKHTKPMRDYYNKPANEYQYLVGEKNRSWMGIVAVDKTKTELKIENTFDPEFYIDLSKNWSIALWMQHFNPNAGHFMYIGNNKNNGIEFFVKNDSLNVKYQNDEIFKISVTNKKAPYHLTWTNHWRENKQFVTLYINGKEIISKEIIKKKELETKFFIGIAFKGMMNDYRIYNQQINDSQIQLIYNDGNMHFTPKLNANGKDFEPVQHYTYKAK